MHNQLLPTGSELRLTVKTITVSAEQNEVYAAQNEVFVHNLSHTSLVFVVLLCFILLAILAQADRCCRCLWISKGGPFCRGGQ